ncbi:MAG: OmpA family protein [Halieaceae bacterium]|nr:OmpA family protein [Halieaceae bacterium]
MLTKALRFSALMLAAVLTAACSGLQKNPSLLEAEAFYNATRQNENVLRYAPDELQRAEQALQQAAVAETNGDMTSLAYVAQARTRTALAIADRKVAKIKLAELSKTKEAARLQARDMEVNLLRSELEALQAVDTDRGMVITLGDVLFSTGKADLQPGAMSTIERLALFMAEYPAKTVLIEGYTDDVGSENFNLGLSDRRAASVRNALLAAGVSPLRISTIGYGEARPIASNSTPEGRQMNRRVEIVIQD